MTQSIILKGPEQVEAACRLIRSINLNPDAPKEVVVRDHKKTRSLAQNALYWQWIGILSKQTGYSKDEVHELMAKKFLPPVIKEVMGEIVEYRTSTTKLKVGEMSEYMSHVDRFAAEHGVSLPHPEDVFQREAA